MGRRPRRADPTHGSIRRATPCTDMPRGQHPKTWPRSPGDPCGPRRIRPRLPAFCERSELCCVPPAIKIADPLDHSGAEPATSSFSQAQGHRLSIKLIYTNKTYYLLIILYNERDPLDPEGGEATTQVGPPAPGDHPGWRRDAEAMPACQNVKALTNHRHGYRLRIGNYRVLFSGMAPSRSSRLRK